MRPRRLVAAVLAVPLLVLAAHLGVRAYSRMPSPAVHLAGLRMTSEGGIRRAGASWVHSVGSLLEVRLAGTPAAIGEAQSVLLHDEMVETEGVVWRLLDEKVPNRAARLLLLDVGQYAYRRLAGSMSGERRDEIAAGAAAFRPDPFADRFDTFQRFVYLASLYDISLGYEHSPLVGCTTFTFSGAGAAGSPILARAFDFDVDDVFDKKKAVFLVSEDGKIPFASVAWPGLVGVVSGMNREGLAVVVHGARAGPTRTTGEIVVHELRRVLSEARTTDEAVATLAKTDPLVSHIVIVNDASGHAAVIERVPGARPFARPLPDRAAVTNHLEGPFASDPKNERVREVSSTLPRRERGDELVKELSHPATVEDAVRLLRDREGPGGAHLALGDRRAIDALIATHSVVMETATRRLWVSEAPHSLGRFVAFDLTTLLAPGAEPTDAPEAHPVVAADPLLTSGDYAKLVAKPSAP
ncbi:MAG TPA: C45 family peptidase [Polyangiaceae bacterium]|jgi:hypothetical protein|nr:C45 family peptidase [Polyangiaceae bacterium]